MLAVDLGGTAIKGAVVDAHGRARRELVRPTPVARGTGGGRCGALEAAVTELAADEAVRRRRAVVPASSTSTAGRIVFAGNLGLRDLRCPRSPRGTHRAADGRRARRARGGRRRADDRGGAGSGDHIVVVCGTGVAASVCVGGGSCSVPTVSPASSATSPCGPTASSASAVSGAAWSATPRRRRSPATTLQGGEPGVSAREVAERRATDPAAARPGRGVSGAGGRPGGVWRRCSTPT